MSAKDTIAVQRCGLSAKELNEFLSSYPIPSEYDVILPTSTQTIFDAPLDYIIPSKYPQLLLDENKLDSKSFRDKLPSNIDENPYFQRLGRYPTSVRVFDDPILFLAGLNPSWEFGQQQPAIIMGGKEMAFKNFIYIEDDDDLTFLLKDPSPGFGESLKAGVFVVHPGSVAARIKEKKCKTMGGSVRPPVKRKLASGSSSSRVVRAKNSASKDDAPFLPISNDDEGHLDNQMDLELLDLHDCCYARQAVVDNAVNRRAYEFLQVIERISGEADVIKARERSREEECKGLRPKCEAAMAEFDQNPTVWKTRRGVE
ncbi:hypothetical protein Tco_0951430 [Tanacetum coccineum]|uniref:Uncharacterized protein n=1 Tax=Tanacetum coccineum TaxID=301880 RepID=A0ABQ5DUI9_9ASTR